MGIRLTGDKKLDRTLSQLPSKLQRQVLRSAVAAGGSALAKEIRRRAPTRRRFEQIVSAAGGKVRRRSIGLKRSIVTRAWSKPSRGLIGRVVGPSHETGRHGYLVEFGHAQTKAWGRDVSPPKEVRPYPFQRPAMDASRRAVLAALAARAKRRLAKLGVR